MKGFETWKFHIQYETFKPISASGNPPGTQRGGGMRWVKTNSVARRVFFEYSRKPSKNYNFRNLFISVTFHFKSQIPQIQAEVSRASVSSLIGGEIFIPGNTEHHT